MLTFNGSHKTKAPVFARSSTNIVRVAFAAVLAAFATAGAGAQPALKIFDAHLHYNQEPNPYYPLERVLEVSAATMLPASSPTAVPTRAPINSLTRRRRDFGVVPFIRPYRTREDVQNWSTESGDLRPGRDRA